MKTFRGDLHIHSVLSPCGDLEMSPSNIIRRAKTSGLDMIAITDHNSTKQCQITIELGKKENLFVLPGCEVTTREEVHCLCYFEELNTLDIFQKFLDSHLIVVPNEPELFGYQAVVNEKDHIMEMEDRYLGSAIDVGIEELESYVHQLNGIFIPAHVDRPRNSLFSQLGFIPENLRIDALQLSKGADEEYCRIRYSIDQSTNLVRFSDAHFPNEIGTTFTWFKMKNISYNEIRKALSNEDGRAVTLP